MSEESWLPLDLKRIRANPRESLVGLPICITRRWYGMAISFLAWGFVREYNMKVTQSTLHNITDATHRF
jgi:hypothetical protein